MAPREPIWPLEPHTKAKHELLRHYLGAWYPILSSSGRQRLVFLDGFAGPGIYQGGEPGSPIIALDVLLGHSAFTRMGSEFAFLFLEPDKQRYQSLREQLELRRQRQGGWPANVRVQTSDMTFEAWAQSILATPRPAAKIAGAHLRFRRPVRIQRPARLAMSAAGLRHL